MSTLEDPEVEAVVAFVTRWLSKTGDLTHYSGELAHLASILSEQDIIRLYQVLAAERLEFEWRDTFIEHFPGSESFLPPLSVTRDDYRKSLAAGKVRFLSGADQSRRHDA